MNICIQKFEAICRVVVERHFHIFTYHICIDKWTILAILQWNDECRSTTTNAYNWWMHKKFHCKNIISINVILIFAECFPVNTFEQLMINYTNEVMQNFCLKSVMKDEEVLKTFHHDDVIDLMENPKMGILTLLDDEVKLQATANFAEIVYKNCSSSPVLIKQNIMSTLFTVQHYAAKVTYQTVNGWKFTYFVLNLILYSTFSVSHLLIFKQENFVETNTGATSETVLKLAEVSLRNITNTEVSLPRMTKRFSEGLKLKHQLQQLIATLEVNVNICSHRKQLSTIYSQLTLFRPHLRWTYGEFVVFSLYLQRKFGVFLLICDLFSFQEFLCCKSLALLNKFSNCV